MDITNLESALLLGETKYNNWREKFEAEFYAPVARRMVRLVLQQLTPEQKRLLQLANPGTFEEANRFSGLGGV